MQGQPVGFESSYQRYLDAEQRRAVLEALGGKINPDSTLGEVIDAAEALGWSEQMGDLSLADLADALLAPEATETEATDEDELEAADEDELEYEDEEDELEEDEEEEELDEEEEEEEEDEDEQLELVEEPPARARRSKKKAAKKKTASASKKKAAKKKAASASKKKATKKKAASASKKKATKKKAAAKKKSRRKPLAVEVDERMSLDQAAEFFIPYVEELGEATMQALEESTGVARRKLRFHIGQLVRNEYLERHGMGRGTYYTVC